MKASTEQVLDVWMQLEDAYRGVSDYNGHEAEIYRHLVMRYYPGYRMCPPSERKPDGILDGRDLGIERDAFNTILEICELFAEQRNAHVEMTDHQGHRYHIEAWPEEHPGKSKGFHIREEFL